MRGEKYVGGFSKIVRTSINSNVYSKKPPYGPPDEYPTIAKEELDKLHESITGSVMSINTYEYMKLVEEDLRPRSVRIPKAHHISGNYLEIPWFYTMYYQRMVGYVIRGDIDR